MRQTETEASAGEQAEAPIIPVWEKIAGRLALDSAKAHRFAAVVLAILTLELAFAIARGHCPTLNAMVWDVSTLLDGGYRVLLGQRPHVDFYSPIGAFCLVLLAGGIRMAGFASAFAAVHAVMLIALVAWTWTLLWSRTSAVLAAIIPFWVGVLAVAPRSLGFPPPMVTYSMQYNRWGWALLSIACIELFLPRRDGVIRAGAGLSTGLVAGLLLFLKPNYLAAILVAILVRLLLSSFNWKWAAGLAGGFLAVAVAGFWYLQFNFGAYLADLRLLAAVQTLPTRIAYIIQLSAANIPDLWFLASAMLIAVPCARRAKVSSARKLQIVVPPIALAGLGILTCSANYQLLQIPLIYLAVFLLVEYVRRIGGDCERWGSVAFLMVFLIAAGAAVKPFFDDITTLLAAGSQPTEPKIRDWPRLETAALAGLRLEPRPDDISTEAVRGSLRAGAIDWREDAGDAYPYVLWFNAGVDLLRDRLAARPRVLVMDLSNPFSFALGLEPPTGDALFWHYKRDFDLVHFPDPSRVFGTVTDVMIPKTPIHRFATNTLRQIYGPVLARDFRLAAENDLWIRYQRRNP